MTTAAAYLILGRPVENGGDDSEGRICKLHGVEKIDGLHCLYQGDTFVGVKVRCVWSQGYLARITGTEMNWSPEQEAEARELCERLPDSLKADPRLLPFGAYLVGDDG